MKGKILFAAAALAAALGSLQACAPLMVGAAAAGALVATDRRPPGIYIEDENIEWRVIGVLKAYPDAHVNATSYNRRVLLTGEVPKEADKAKIEEAAKAVLNVREVVSELRIAGASSMAARGNDGLITTNVKTLLLNNDGKFHANHVKVVTEANVVYLMGLLTQAEADAAVEIARKGQGVLRVVKVFEYVNP
jgi:osmotically-inducible protein OsmY